ncbi:hypothetical protein A0H76_930 [Hepatospora eriocheir]|uniref:Uncharacterized protein n=1 Tax=Hepatospora eriocheir TaxID=1081669 RepID=A0A1X0QKY2_9MICR|nr:hypothetical protein A0H76_930 [Hepatospora eriocheir]
MKVVKIPPIINKIIPFKLKNKYKNINTVENIINIDITDKRLHSCLFTLKSLLLIMLSFFDEIFIR